MDTRSLVDALFELKILSLCTISIKIKTLAAHY